MRVIVIGGGAAGFFGGGGGGGAFSGGKIVLFEKGAELLAKGRVSRGGRCNVTHACFDPGLLVQHYPRGAQALRGPFSRFQPEDTIAWFAQHGVELKTEADGRMFPVTDQSSTIVDCLKQSAEKAGVRVRTE